MQKTETIISKMLAFRKCCLRSLLVVHASITAIYIYISNCKIDMMDMRYDSEFSIYQCILFLAFSGSQLTLKYLFCVRGV